jgi:hypothetical protein
LLSKATSKEGKEGGIELIQPPADSKPGDRVYFEGEEFESQYFLVSQVSYLNHSSRRNTSLSIESKEENL